jgi:hypothetical protein
MPRAEVGAEFLFQVIAERAEKAAVIMGRQSKSLPEPTTSQGGTGKSGARKQKALSSGEKGESNSEFRIALAPSLPLSVGSRQMAVGSKGSGSLTI